MSLNVEVIKVLASFTRLLSSVSCADGHKEWYHKACNIENNLCDSGFSIASYSDPNDYQEQWMAHTLIMFASPSFDARRCC